MEESGGMASSGLDGAPFATDSELPNKKEQSPLPQEQKKKKKQKGAETILRDFPQHMSDAQKIQALCERLYECQQEQKNINSKVKQYEQLAKTIKQERDVLQNERNRLLLQKDKLETLCRELQKQNKVIQEESLARMRVEDEKRREVADHFQECITSIQTQLNEYQTRNTDLRKENQDLADKLGDFIKHHEKREEHLQKIMQTRDLEVKLAEAKLNKMQCQMDQERVKAQHQVIRMEEEAKLMKERMDTHIDLETKLKEQIEFYKTKYKSFNKTMADSNRLFDSAKEEMEKLGKRVRQAERDVVEWRGKWELSQRKLLELVEEHKKKTEEAEASKKRADRLTCLCRALQDQLSEMRKPNADVAREPDSATSVQPNGDGSNEVHTNNSEVVAQVCAPTTILEHSETNNCPSSTPHTLQSDRIERRKQTETVEPDESSASTVQPSTPVNEQTVQDEVLGDTTENPN